MLYFTVGLAIGIFQFFCLKKILTIITAAANIKAALPYLVLKLAVYGAAITLFLTLFRSNILWAGIGLAAGIVAMAAVFIIREFFLKGDEKK